MKKLLSLIVLLSSYNSWAGFRCTLGIVDAFSDSTTPQTLVTAVSHNIKFINSKGYRYLGRTEDFSDIWIKLGYENNRSKVFITFHDMVHAENHIFKQTITSIDRNVRSLLAKIPNCRKH